MLVWGTFDAIAFRLTRSLLTLFPLTWAVGGGSGTLMGGIIAGWDWVILYAVILVVQIAALVAFARVRRPTSRRS